MFIFDVLLNKIVKDINMKNFFIVVIVLRLRYFFMFDGNYFIYF